MALAACLAGMLVPSPSAVASRRPPEGTKANPLPSPGGFEIAGSNGYTITVLADSRLSRRPMEVLVVAGRPGFQVVYATRGIVSANRASVDLGAVGHIDVHYVPDGRVRHEAYHCDDFRGPPPRVYFDGGSYVGTVEVRGEEGFTEAVASEVDGDIRWRLGCPSGISEGYPGAGLLLDAGAGHRRFSAIQNEPGGDVLFFAEIAERADAISIYREVLFWGDPGDLSTDERLRTARVTPPAPFSGTGTFVRRHRGRGTWRGDLEVDFPGRAGVPLAGSEFEARFKHGFREFHRVRTRRGKVAAGEGD